MDIENPRISVIMCAHTMERLNDIHEAVNSILNQTQKPFEVILSIDHNEELFENLQSLLHTSNSSIPGEKSGATTHNPELKIVLNTSIKGACETRNVGSRAATGDILVFVDDDIVAEPDWLENLVLPFKNDKVMAIEGKTVPLWPGNRPPFWFPEEFDFIFGGTAHKKLLLMTDNEIRNVLAGNMAIRKDIFIKIGGWETNLGPGSNESSGKLKINYMGGEEAELCLRIKNEMPAASIVYESRATVYHKVTAQRATLKYVFKWCFSEGVAKGKVFRLASQYLNNPLANENMFLRRLLTFSIPQRLRRLHDAKNLAQIGLIIANTALTGTGYMVGRWRLSDR